MKLSTKLNNYSMTLSESAGFFTYVGVLLVTLAASHFSFQATEYIVVNQVYGHAAWIDGLRIADGKHGVLSNGDYLSGWPYVVFYLGSFSTIAIFFCGSFFLFSYIGLRLHGRKLSDPRPQKKKKWQSFK